MDKMIHTLRISYFTLIAYFLLCNTDLYANDGWWKSEVLFSDWRNVKCDYSTNAIVDWWYNGKCSQYFRKENMKEIVTRLQKGDTLSIGIDYYGLTISSPFIPIEFLRRYQFDLLKGKVITAKIFRVGNVDYWSVN